MRDLFSLSYRIPAGYTGQHFPHGERTFHARRSIPSGPDTLLVFASLLSLRTSDRCHWCGDPSVPLASLSEGGGIRRSPARRMTEGVVPRFAAGTSIARLLPPSCHCEPVTDVTGAAIRLPSSPPCYPECRRSRSRRILQKRIFVFVQERA